MWCGKFLIAVEKRPGTFYRRNLSVFPGCCIQPVNHISGYSVHCFPRQFHGRSPSCGNIRQVHLSRQCHIAVNIRKTARQYIVIIFFICADFKFIFGCACQAAYSIRSTFSFYVSNHFILIACSAVLINLISGSSLRLFP